MLDILEQFLNEKVTSELKTTIGNSIQIFEDFNLPDYEEKYEQILMLHDSVDASTTSTAIFETTYELVTQLLNEHGTFYNEETPLDVLNNFLRAIHEIQIYDNPDDVIRTCQLDESENVVFCELISLVSEMPVEQMLIYVDKVDKSLISRIYDLMLLWNGEEHEEVSIDAVKELVLRLKAFTRFIMSTDLIAVNLLTLGTSANLPYAVYLDIVGKNIEMMKNDYAAKELIGLALISSDASNNTQIAIRNNIEKYISDPIKITAIDIEVSKLLLGFSQ